MPEKHQRFNNCEAVTIGSVVAKSIKVVADSDLRDDLAGAVFLEAEFADQAEFDPVSIKEGRELVLKGKPRETFSGGRGIFGSIFGRSNKVTVGDIVGNHSVSFVDGRVFRDGVEVLPQGDTVSDKVTMDLVLVVPVGFPVRLIGEGQIEFTVDPRGGRLVADLSGSCGLKVSDVTSLEIECGGSCEVTIKRLRGGGQPHRGTRVRDRSSAASVRGACAASAAHGHSGPPARPRVWPGGCGPDATRERTSWPAAQERGEP
jgi:hypothetical protein